MTVTANSQTALRAFDTLIGNLPPLTRIIQRGTGLNTARWWFHFNDGRILEVPNAKTLFSRTTMETLISIEFHAYLIEGKPNEWRRIVTGLLANACELELDPDEKLSASVEDWIERYRDAHATITDPQEAARRRLPFITPGAGQLHVNVDDFVRWVRTHLFVPITAHEARTALQDLHWAPARVNYDSEGAGRGRRRTTARYYREPWSR